MFPLVLNPPCLKFLSPTSRQQALKLLAEIVHIFFELGLWPHLSF